LWKGIRIEWREFGNGEGQGGGEMGVVEWRWQSDGVVDGEDVREGIRDERETIEEKPDGRREMMNGWTITEIAYDIAYA